MIMIHDMMKKILLFFTVVCGTLICNAQTAEDILDKASAVMSAKGGISADFKIDMDNSQTFVGKLSIKGDKMRLLTAGASMWFDGTTLWTYIKKNGEVNITTPEEKMLNRLNPTKLLSVYKNGYACSMVQSGTDYVITLNATSTTSDIPEMVINIDMSTYLISQIKFRMKKGWNTATFASYDMSTLPDNIFTFKSSDYPDAEVIDLR